MKITSIIFLVLIVIEVVLMFVASKIVFSIYFLLVHNSFCAWLLWFGGAKELEETRLSEILFNLSVQMQQEMLAEELIRLCALVMLIVGNGFLVFYLIAR